MFFRKMSIFRVNFCPEDFPELDFLGNYPSDEKFSGIDLQLFSISREMHFITCVYLN